MKNQLAKFFLPILGLGVVVALVTVVGCSNASSPATSYNDTPNSLIAPNYSTSEDVTSSFGDISDLSVLGDKPSGDANKERNPRLIIRCLELSRDQAGRFNEAMSAYERCVKSAREAYRAEEKSIRERTSAAEREIKAQVEAGTLTRDEARARMKEITTAARTALQAAKEAYTQSVRACRETLMSSIESILTPAQLEIWRKWLATGVIPCKEAKGREPRDSVKR
ncbi:MAG: hypothetical protein JST20_08335 [Bacteroidetes bacterium]|nr:hypothetical protein [Bacteroidota bacterium]